MVGSLTAALKSEAMELKAVSLDFSHWIQMKMITMEVILGKPRRMMCAILCACRGLRFTCQTILPRSLRLMSKFLAKASGWPFANAKEARLDWKLAVFWGLNR